MWASTSQSSLSTPRETSVNRSAVSASRCFAAVSILVDLPLGAKAVGLIAPVFTTALLPEFMRSLGDLLFEAYVFMHFEDWPDGFVICCLFHCFVISWLAS
jgi:hypothetical protein